MIKSAYSIAPNATNGHTILVDTNLIDLEKLIMAVNHRKQKKDLYTQGATAGLLKDLFPPDVGRHIGTFIDRTTGEKIGTTRKAAHDYGKINVEASDQRQENITRKLKK